MAVSARTEDWWKSAQKLKQKMVQFVATGSSTATKEKFLSRYEENRTRVIVEIQPGQTGQTF